ncbi:MAG: PAS-domain containing protein [Aquabacterium sp.]|nr:PAS-domain containing protein [Aquabacterium sp.]
MTGDEPSATIALPLHPDRIDGALRAERLRLYRANLGSALAGQGLMAAFLVVVLWGQVAHGRLLGWLACLVLALVGRLIAQQPGSPERDDATMLLRLRLSLCVMGLIWGATGTLLFPPEGAVYQVFLYFLLAGMAAGTLTLTAFDLFAAMGFCLLALTPLCVRLLGTGSTADAAMAGMVMMFVTFLSMTGLRAQRNLRDTVALRTADALRADTLLRNQARLQQLSTELTVKTEALELTLDSMAQGILSIGADGRTNFHNQRMLQLLDLPQALMAARPSMDDITRYQTEHGHFGDDLHLMDDATRAAFSRWRNGGLAEFPPSYVRRTLAGLVLEVKSRYLPGGGVVRTFSDVTPYFDAQQKLADSEAQARKLALVAAHTDNAVTITDAQRRIEWVNEGFTRLTGYRLDEAVGRLAAELLRGADSDAAEVARMDQQLRMELRTTGELQHVAKSGRRYWFAVETQAILDDAGQVRQYISIGRDISERKAAEQALRAARDEAQRASQAKSEFLSAMSHELRTPMNAILGFAQLLAADPSFPLPARQQGQVREILRAGAHLLELISDVLDLARVEAGKQPIVIESVAVATLMDDCLALMRPVAQERNIRLETAHATIPCTCCVAADRTRLKQVMLNLLSNAIKYNHDGGRVLLDCVDEHDAVCIRVSDTGPGLSPDQRERLFNAFDRLGAEGSAVEGAGIGLVLSKRMVELMHGHIGVDSAPGVGSTFSVRLPSAPAPALAPEHDRTAAMTLPGELSGHVTSTVLYIEDNPVNLLLMEAMLEHEPGVRLITAQDPLLGITLARTERPQLILLDIQLPGIDGFEVLRRLRGADATRDVPVIAISANAMRSDIQQGMDAGFDDYLTKPLDLTRLRARVRRALQR